MHRCATLLAARAPHESLYERKRTAHSIKAQQGSERETRRPVRLFLQQRGPLALCVDAGAKVMQNMLCDIERCARAPGLLGGCAQGLQVPLI